MTIICKTKKELIKAFEYRYKELFEPIEDKDTKKLANYGYYNKKLRTKVDSAISEFNDLYSGNIPEDLQKHLTAIKNKNHDSIKRLFENSDKADPKADVLMVLHLVLDVGIYPKNTSWIVEY